VFLERFWPQHNTPRGILCVIGAMFGFSVMAALAKHLGGHYSVFEICFFRYLFGFIPLLPILALRGGLKVFKTKHLVAHFWRTFVGVVALIIYFYSINMLPLAEAFVISFTNPIFITLLSVVLLKEKVGKDLWAAVIVGFIGVIIAVHPDGLSLQPGVFVAFAAIPFYSMAMISVRMLTQKDGAVTVLAYFTLFSSLMCAIPAALTWKSPDFGDFLVLALTGIVGGCSQTLLTKAYHYAPPQMISPFNYTSIVWGTLFGFLFWGETPDSIVWIGAAIVIASGIYIAQREKILRKPLPVQN
jgi:drug/metabolite transporter (DMT)-like permease